MKKWKVELTKKSSKLKKKLPTKITDILAVLMKEMEILGPTRGNWPNFSKLSKDTYHCHLKKGNPTYVACWRVNKENVYIEVYYVGTHEKAPY